MKERKIGRREGGKYGEVVRGRNILSSGSKGRGKKGKKRVW